jgi:hypothetical protein
LSALFSFKDFTATFLLFFGLPSFCFDIIVSFKLCYFHYDVKTKLEE